MRKVSALIFSSLDGVMQSPATNDEDPSNDFNAGGWAAPYWNDAMELALEHAMSEDFDLLLGRNTYEQFYNHFATQEELTAQKLNKSRKYLITHQSGFIPMWANTTVINHDILKTISTLKYKEGPLIQLHGSWKLLQYLWSNQLVDELRLITFPVLIGSGKRLFEESDITTNFEIDAVHRNRNILFSKYIKK
ncbi:MAG: dihydrofolate reductase family protein [Kangiellaceae bacterium]|nr:dihydrofolate reductase family protein [Kangiellaceae bacterium]